METLGLVRLKVPKCPMCGRRTRSIVVRQDDWDRYAAGALIQDAFPSLTAMQRETIKTGYDSVCWDKLVEAWENG